MNLQERLPIIINKLLLNNPFYAHFFLNCKVTFDRIKQIPTAGVMIVKDGIEMTFNTEWTNSHTDEEICGVVEHEVLHILFDHISNMDPKKTKSQHNIENIAMDCSINQYIKCLPKIGVKLEELNKSLGLNMLPEQTWEYYYQQLMTVQDKLPKSYVLDTHTGDVTDENGNPVPKDIADAIMKDVANKSLTACKGVVPDHLTKVIERLNAPSKLPWKTILSNFIARTTSTTRLGTRSKSNRRFELDQPGIKKKRELTLAVCRDSSGSISDDQYMEFHNEICRISKFVSKIVLIDADCVVQNVQILKKNKLPENKRFGNGGTAYQPAIDKATENRVDAIVFFGDFDCADTPNDPKVPFLWVGVGNSPVPGKFGNVVRL